MFRSSPFRRTNGGVTFHRRKVTKRRHSFSPTPSVSAKAVVAMKPLHYLTSAQKHFCYHDTKSIVRRSAVKPHNAALQIAVNNCNCNAVSTTTFSAPKVIPTYRKGSRTQPNVRGKPPTAKERHQRRATAENRMIDFIKF